jgi:cell fate regulator YaaT (PSP1 superfamily)
MIEQHKKLLGIRFTNIGKVYHFEPGPIADIKVGDAVIVETSRGWQLGKVASILDKSKVPSKSGWKNVDRVATPRDLMVRQLWERKEVDVINHCQKRLARMNVRGAKFISAEYSFDGARLTLTFSNESEGKVNLKSLRKELQRRYSSTTVEIRQVGPRDVAKTFCGVGACGMEERCCCRFLFEFNSISIRMAKDQGISLTPTEITGICGRLRCCLKYEHPQYKKALKGVPNKNKRVKTPLGNGKVVEIRAMRDEVVVDIPEIGRRVFNKEEISRI